MSTPDIGRAARVVDAVSAALRLEARRRRGGTRAAVSLVSFSWQIDLLLPAGARVVFIAAVVPLRRAPPLVRVGLPAEAFGVHVRGRRQVVDGALAAREDAGRVARHDRVPVRARGGLVRPRAAPAGVILPPILQHDLVAGRLLPVLAHGALEVRQRAVGARRPGPAVLVAAPVAHAHAFAVDVEVAAVVVAAVLVRAQVARVVAGAIRVLVVATGAGVVPGGSALEVVGLDGARLTALIYRFLAMIV